MAEFVQITLGRENNLENAYKIKRHEQSACSKVVLTNVLIRSNLSDEW